MFALNNDFAWDVTYNYFKLVIFTFIIIYCVKDEFYLKAFVLCFFLIVLLYTVLSFREFLLGQHVYDMGVKRMLGWDNQTSPNRFGMMCVCFLPFSFLMLKQVSYVPLHMFKVLIMPKGLLRILAKFNIILSIVCVFLTNSRSSLVLLVFLVLLKFLRTKKKILILVLIATLTTLILGFLPESTKNRYMSIFYSAGIIERTQPMTRVDQWTDASAQGRLFGLKRGLELYRQYPLLGVGPGGFQFVSGNNLQAHNILGQAASEVGTLGILTFVGMLFFIFRNLKKITSNDKEIVSVSYSQNLRVTILDSLYLLIIGSIFAHTLFFSWWLFLGAFSVLRYSYCK